MNDLTRGLKGLDADAPAHRIAEDYYSGDTDEIFTSSLMSRKLAKSNVSKIRINFSKVAVDAVASRIEIAALTSPEPAAQDLLDELWITNQLDLELPGLFLRTLIYGESYLILDGDEADGVNLFYNSPLSVKMFYSPENPRKKQFAIKRWLVPDSNTDKNLVRVNLYYPDRIERYVAPESKDSALKAAAFLPYFDSGETEADSIVPNIYGFIPVYHFKTSFNSVPEHKETYGSQNAINKLAVTHLATIEYLGFPQRWFSTTVGTDMSIMDTFDSAAYHDPEAPDATIAGPDYTARVSVPDTSGETPYRAEPGSMWGMPPGTTVGQFQAADSSNFLDSMQQHIRMMAQVSNTPMHYFDPQAGAPSGESLRTADSPLVKKVIMRELAFGGALKDCLTDALTVLGQDSAVDIHWVSPTTNDDLDTWQVVIAKINAGVPRYQALLENGYTELQLAKMGIAMNDAPVVPAQPDLVQPSLAVNDIADL